MLINSFLAYLSSEKKYSQHTISAYRNDLISFQEFYKNTYNLSAIENANYGEIRNWIVSLVESKISNATINRKISALKTFYKFLLRTRQLKNSPLINHKALKMEKRVQVPFSKTEIFKVLDIFENSDNFDVVRDKLMIELLYSTGMRRAELIQLEVRDIDCSKQMVKVHGKRNKERYIPLIKTVLITLTKYLSLKNNLSTDSSRLFVTKKGKKLYGSFVYRKINNYFSIVSTKVKKSPHMIRHSFATHLLNEGADLNSIKELLGHESLASTQVYTHNSLGKLREMYNSTHPRSTKN